ncbi:MFS transporter [Actinacidiphila soli]|uniref:MFS transporter n=1 Tax=Actinacidiphila soli TaxID=2487275 RepID=UPI000FCAF6A8|nr:MFS transporter [Actinacidiphila soli]
MALNVASQHDEKSADRSRFGVRFGVILIILLWSFNLNSLVGGMAGTAQAQVALHYHTTQIVWFTQVATLLGVFTTPFTAKAAGMFGKRRVLIVITALGFIGDLISALSTDYATLLIGRGVAGFYVPSGVLVFALARDVFPRRQVRPASGLLAGSIGLVMFGAPFLSGTLLDNHGFRGVLWFMVIASAAAVVTLLFVPESPVCEPRTRVDWLGGILLGGGLTAIIYGIGNGTDWGWTSIRTLAYIIGGFAAVLAFLFVESRTAHPILPLTLLGRRRVWTMLLVTTLVMGAFVGQSTVMSLLQLMPSIPHVSAGLGWTATKAAWVGFPSSMLIVTTSLVTGVLARRVDSRRLLVVGALLMAAGLALIGEFHHSVPQVMFLGLISALGLAICLAVGPILMIESVSAEEQTVAGGTQNLLQGVAFAVLTQVVFVLLSQHDHVVQGTALYSDTSYRNALWVFAALALAGTLLTALIPKAVRIGDAGAAVEDGQTV